MSKKVTIFPNLIRKWYQKWPKRTYFDSCDPKCRTKFRSKSVIHGFWDQIFPMCWNFQMPITAQVVVNFMEPCELQTFTWIWHRLKRGYGCRQRSWQRCLSTAGSGELCIHVHQLKPEARWIFPQLATGAGIIWEDSPISILPNEFGVSK